MNSTRPIAHRVIGTTLTLALLAGLSVLTPRSERAVAADRMVAAAGRTEMPAPSTTWGRGPLTTQHRDG